MNQIEELKISEIKFRILVLIELMNRIKAENPTGSRRSVIAVRSQVEDNLKLLDEIMESIAEGQSNITNVFKSRIDAKILNLTKLQAIINDDPDLYVPSKVTVENESDKFVIVDDELVRYNGDDERVIIPVGVKAIGSFAFIYNDKVKEVIIPQSVTEIKDYAFAAMPNLLRGNIPNSITKIGKYAFEYCSNLTEIAIPESVEEIGFGAFGHCPSLKHVYVSQGNKNYKSGTSIILNKEGTKVLFANEYSIIPTNEELISIASGAFYGADSLNVYIPKNIKTIETKAFVCCAIGKIYIPSTGKEVEEYAFIYCDSMRKFVVEGKDTSIKNNSICECVSLDDLVIPSSYKENETEIIKSVHSDNLAFQYY